MSTLTLVLFGSLLVLLGGAYGWSLGLGRGKTLAHRTWTEAMKKMDFIHEVDGPDGKKVWRWRRQDGSQMLE